MEESKPEVQDVKPGFKTTEFYLSSLAMIVSIVYASGIVESGSNIDKVIGFISMALVAMGYSVSRGLAKK